MLTAGAKEFYTLLKTVQDDHSVIVNHDVVDNESTTKGEVF